MNRIKSFQEIQGFLSIGYIYLILMGILNETFYYQQIGIDILKYSSILDVLISPIYNLTSSILNIVIFLTVVFFAFKAPEYLAKRKDKNWFKKSFKIDRTLDEKQTKNELQKSFLFMLSLGILAFFVGTGFGKGIKTSKQIENNEISYSDKLTFINGETDAIKILGSNSAYVFYLLEGNKSVQISPISGVVQRIEDNKGK